MLKGVPQPMIRTFHILTIGTLMNYELHNLLQQGIVWLNYELHNLLQQGIDWLNYELHNLLKQGIVWLETE